MPKERITIVLERLEGLQRELEEIKKEHIYLKGIIEGLYIQNAKLVGKQSRSKN